MATETTPAGTAAVAAAPAAVTEAPAQATTQTPADAHDTSLADAVAEHARRTDVLNGKAPAAEPEKTEEAPAEEQTEAAKEPAATEEAPAKETQPAETTTEAAKPAEEKPKEEPPVDERAKALAEYVRGKRNLRREMATVAAEKAKLQEEAGKVAAEKQSVAALAALKDKAKSDPLGAVEALLGRQLEGDLLVSALERATQREQGQPVAPVVSEEERQSELEEKAATKALEKLKASQDEDRKRQEAEQKAATERGQAAYFGAVEKHLAANADKYPMMAAEGWDTADMAKAIEAHHKATGQWPNADQVLTHFEAEHEKIAERKAQLLAKKRGSATSAAVPDAVKKSPAAAPAPVAVDSKGKTPRVIKETDPRRRIDEIAARLDGRPVG